MTDGRSSRKWHLHLFQCSPNASWVRYVLKHETLWELQPSNAHWQPELGIHFFTPSVPSYLPTVENALCGVTAACELQPQLSGQLQCFVPPAVFPTVPASHLIFPVHFWKRIIPLCNTVTVQHFNHFYKPLMEEMCHKYVSICLLWTCMTNTQHLNP